MSRNRLLAGGFYLLMAGASVWKIWVPQNTYLLLAQLVGLGFGFYFLIRDTPRADKTLLQALSWLLVLVCLLPLVGIVVAVRSGQWLSVPSSVGGLLVLAGLAILFRRLANRPD